MGFVGGGLAIQNPDKQGLYNGGSRLNSMTDYKTRIVNPYRIDGSAPLAPISTIMLRNVVDEPLGWQELSMMPTPGKPQIQRPVFLLNGESKSQGLHPGYNTPIPPQPLPTGQVFQEQAPLNINTSRLNSPLGPDLESATSTVVNLDQREGNGQLITDIALGTAGAVATITGIMIQQVPSLLNSITGDEWKTTVIEAGLSAIPGEYGEKAVALFRSSQEVKQTMLKFVRDYSTNALAKRIGEQVVKGLPEMQVLPDNIINPTAQEMGANTLYTAMYVIMALGGATLGTAQLKKRLSGWLAEPRRLGRPGIAAAARAGLPGAFPTAGVATEVMNQGANQIRQMLEVPTSASNYLQNMQAITPETLVQGAAIVGGAAAAGTRFTRKNGALRPGFAPSAYNFG